MIFLKSGIRAVTMITCLALSTANAQVTSVDQLLGVWKANNPMEQRGIINCGSNNRVISLSQPLATSA